MTTTVNRLAGPDGLPAERPPAPVKVWAAVGAAFLALELWIFGAWLTSGTLTPTPHGPDSPPGWMKAAVRCWEGLMVVAVVFVAWRFVIRPWRREGHLTADGMMALALASLWWQDPLINYTQTWFTYNTHFLNVGSWSEHIPGWLAPQGQQLPMPLLGIGGAYAGMNVMVIFAVSSGLRRAKNRWPHLGKMGLIAICFGICAVFDLLLEPYFFLPLGLLEYPGAIRGLSLNAGTYYQFPITQAFVAAAFFTGLASLRFFRNDKGETFAERGVSDLRISRRRSNGMRFLALTGACNVLFLATNVLPNQWFALHADPWPEDIQRRSYLTDGFCGRGTPYACSGPGTPIPRPESARLGRDGTIVGP